MVKKYSTSEKVKKAPKEKVRLSFELINSYKKKLKIILHSVGKDHSCQKSCQSVKAFGHNRASDRHTKKFQSVTMPCWAINLKLRPRFARLISLWLCCRCRKGRARSHNPRPCRVQEHSASQAAPDLAGQLALRVRLYHRWTALHQCVLRWSAHPRQSLRSQSFSR